MNRETTIDWESWEVEEPAPDFADKVMNAALAEGGRSSPVWRRRSRFFGAVAAAALAAGALTVLAMVGHDFDGRDRGMAPPNATAPLSEATARLPKARYAAGTVVDRALRAEKRAQIVPALYAQGVDRDSHTGLIVPSGLSGPSHNLTRAYLQQRIREDFYPMGLACYEEALSRNSTLSGQVVVDFMIVGDAKVGGIVDQAEINERTDIADVAFTTCIRESMLSMVFAPPDNDGWVSVTYPFVFAPHGDGEIYRDE